MKVVAPGDGHEGQIGTIYELLDDDSGVCVMFSGDSEPYAFRRDEVEALLPGNQTYWDGNGWGEPVGVPADSNKSQPTAVAIGVCVLAVVGLVMSMQSVSLMTGSGPVWTGVAVVGVATAVAFFLGAATWVRVVACVVLAVSLLNGFYIENEMSNMRNEITQIFDN